MDLGVNDSEINNMLAYFDPKRTGTIEYNTFCDRVAKTTTTTPKADPHESIEEKILGRVRLRIQEKDLSVRQAFLAFDANRDGKISSNELIKTLVYPYSKSKLYKKINNEYMVIPLKSEL